MGRGALLHVVIMTITSSSLPLPPASSPPPPPCRGGGPEGNDDGGLLFALVLDVGPSGYRQDVLCNRAKRAGQVDVSEAANRELDTQGACTGTKLPPPPLRLPYTSIAQRMTGLWPTLPYPTLPY